MVVQCWVCLLLFMQKKRSLAGCVTVHCYEVCCVSNLKHSTNQKRAVKMCKNLFKASKMGHTVQFLFKLYARIIF